MLIKKEITVNDLKRIINNIKDDGFIEIIPVRSTEENRDPYLTNINIKKDTVYIEFGYSFYSKILSKRFKVKDLKTKIKKVDNNLPIEISGKKKNNENPILTNIYSGPNGILFEFGYSFEDRIPIL